MKALLIVSILVLVQLNGFGQTGENPWLPKKTENPWENEKTEKQKPKTTPVVVENTITDSSKTVDSVKTIAANNAPQSSYKVDSVRLRKNAYNNAQNDAYSAYKPTGDFAVGFIGGMIGNIFSIPFTAATTVIETPQERVVVKEVVNDPDYAELDEKELRKRTNRGIRKQRVTSSLFGTALGAGTQLLALIIIATNN